MDSGFPSSDLGHNLRVLDPAFHFHTMCPPEDGGHLQAAFNASPPEKKQEVIRRLVTEVEIATQSHAFIGGFKSNVARHITLMHKGRAACHSVDALQAWRPS